MTRRLLSYALDPTGQPVADGDRPARVPPAEEPLDVLLAGVLDSSVHALLHLFLEGLEGFQVAGL